VSDRARLFALCDAALAALAPDGGAPGSPLGFFVPGRIEVLGKHTDYAGGRSLLCAVDRGFAVLARPRDDALIRIVDAVRGETRELSLGSAVEVPRGDWAKYVAIVGARVPRDFPSVRTGFDLAFASNLPAASGMSSSSALLIAVFLALRDVNALEQDPLYQRVIVSLEALADYLGAVENGREFGPLAADHGVGTLGGSQDQTAILCCHADALRRYAFLPVRAEGDVPFPSTHSFVVAYSGVAAEKTAAAMQRYNEASLATVRILELSNVAFGTAFQSLGEAVASTPTARDEIRDVLHASDSDDFSADRLLARFDQFVAETFEIIPAASEALARGDLSRFGELPETIALQRSARVLGATAASAFGAGFGGSVWAMIAREDEERFAAQWREQYAHAFPTAAARAQFIVATPSQGAARIR
jgi:galactokinase